MFLVVCKEENLGFANSPLYWAMKRRENSRVNW